MEPENKHVETTPTDDEVIAATTSETEIIDFTFHDTYAPTVDSQETEHAQADGRHEHQQAPRGIAIKAGAVIVKAAFVFSSLFGTGEAKADEETEPIPADVLADEQCVEHPHEDVSHVGVAGYFTNQSNSTVEAQHRIPSIETTESDGDIWAEFAPGQSSTTPARFTNETSIPETEVIFYARREGEPEQIVGSDTVGPKDCTENNDSGGNEDSEGGAVNPADFERLDGATRIETAIEVSKNEFSNGQAETVVLATAEDYPDALAGGVLADLAGGPLLMTGSGELHGAVDEELERLGPDNSYVRNVYVLGGEAAISEHVVNQLESRGINVTRLGGNDRFETAEMIAREVERLTPEVVDDSPESTTVETTTSTSETETADSGVDATEEVLLARADDFADALAGASLGAQENSPVLLTMRNELHPVTKAYLEGESSRVEQVTVLGGEEAVSENAKNEASVAAEAEATERIGGSTRIETALNVAREKLDRAGNRAERLFFASGYEWPDALAAGPATSNTEDALVLVNGKNADGNRALDDFMSEQRPNVESDQLRKGFIVGGESTITQTVADNIIFTTNAYPTDDGSTSTAGTNSVATTTENTDDDSDDSARSEEIARNQEIDKNSKLVFRRDSNGNWQETIEKAA